MNNDDLAKMSCDELKAELSALDKLVMQYSDGEDGFKVMTWGPARAVYKVEDGTAYFGLEGGKIRKSFFNNTPIGNDRARNYAQSACMRITGDLVWERRAEIKRHIAAFEAEAAVPELG